MTIDNTNLKVGVPATATIYMPYKDSIDKNKLITINSSNTNFIASTSCNIAENEYQCKANITAKIAKIAGIADAVIWASSDSYNDSKIIILSAK